MAGPTLLEKQPQLSERIFELARQGKTDEQIAELIGVTRRTLGYWKVNDVVFASHLKENKDLADDLVEVSLYQNARGFEYEEEVITKDGKDTITRFHPPNPTSQIFWLKNRRAKKWKDRVEVTMDPIGLFKIKTKSGKTDDFTR